MKKLLLALVVLGLVMLVTPVYCARATFSLNAGWNSIGVPLVPFNPSPAAVFAGTNFTALRRFDAPTQAWIDYSPFSLDPFGNILLGNGYEIYVPSATTVTYEGVPDGVPDPNGEMTDMWIAIPGCLTDSQDAGGIHFIGHPFNHYSLANTALVTNGSTVVSLQVAIRDGWLDGLGTNDAYLSPSHAYWVQTHRDDLALIIPAYPAYASVPEPAGIAIIVCGLSRLVCHRKRHR